MIPEHIKEVLPIPEERLIVFMKFGSHLYGTDTPESDTDYKGIYMPTEDQILLNRVPKTMSYHTKNSDKDAKNTKEDIDIQIFSLHYFLDIACNGEMVAMDMLHAPDDWPLVTSSTWKNLRRKRRQFHTKSLRAFVSYARKQAAKYGIKGSRLAAAKTVYEFLAKQLSGASYPYAIIQRADGSELHPISSNLKLKLADVWEKLPEGEHIHKLKVDPKSKLRMYQVCGKKFQETAKLDYVYNILVKFYDDYGHRAKLAEKNEGIDWKAVSHAMRAAMQVSEIFLRNDIQFPLQAAAYLREVKEGKRDYKMEVGPLLELYMEQCEKLSAWSDLPEKVDRKVWDRWLIGQIGSQHERNIGRPGI